MSHYPTLRHRVCVDAICKGIERDLWESLGTPFGDAACVRENLRTLLLLRDWEGLNDANQEKARMLVHSVSVPACDGEREVSETSPPGEDQAAVRCDPEADEKGAS